MEEFDKFYKSSIRFLSLRQRSEKEMRGYLKRKKCNDLTAQKIVESLKRDKFINDEEFARMWIRSHTEIKPRSWRIIKSELKMKGIAEDIIENYESMNKSGGQDKESAFKLAEKKLRTIHDKEKFKIREKLGRYLASRGFDWDTVKDVIDRVLEE